MSPSTPQLESRLKATCDGLATSLTFDAIRSIPSIADSRAAYRRMGQDPNRYRPAAESLLRRVAAGKGITTVNNMVDILNTVSLISGISIGGYDAGKISGDISFGIGSEGERYEGIGRGEINIANLPVFRDLTGAFGSSTSDSVRTMVTHETTLFMMVLPRFEEMGNDIAPTLMLARELLDEFGYPKRIESWTVE